jgi:hypothetical protein
MNKSIPESFITVYTTAARRVNTFANAWFATMLQLAKFSKILSPG